MKLMKLFIVVTYLHNLVIIFLFFWFLVCLRNTYSLQERTHGNKRMHKRRTGRIMGLLSRNKNELENSEQKIKMKSKEIWKMKAKSSSLLFIERQSGGKRW